MPVPEIALIKKGNIPLDVEQIIYNLIEECYQRIQASSPKSMQLLLIDTTERTKTFFKEEKAQLGIANAGNEEFLSFHDAWRDFPRISICLEKIIPLPFPIFAGIIRHEVAHTILHGSRDYYTFKLPKKALELSEERGISRTALWQIVYYLSIAVKDWEATRLLVKHEYKQCQRALALYQLIFTREDEIAWLIAGKSLELKFIFLAAQLKSILFAYPLLKLPEYRPELKEKIELMLQPLSSLERIKVLDLFQRIGAQLGDETHQNMEVALISLLKEI